MAASSTKSVCKIIITSSFQIRKILLRVEHAPCGKRIRILLTFKNLFQIIDIIVHLSYMENLHLLEKDQSPATKNPLKWKAGKKKSFSDSKTNAFCRRKSWGYIITCQHCKCLLMKSCSNISSCSQRGKKQRNLLIGNDLAC